MKEEKRGRKPIAEDRRKRKAFRVRVTETDMNHIKEEAEARGVTVSSYVRGRINGKY